jgi:hypothetical protein
VKGTADYVFRNPPAAFVFLADLPGWRHWPSCVASARQSLSSLASFLHVLLKLPALDASIGFGLDIIKGALVAEPIFKS